MAARWRGLPPHPEPIELIGRLGPIHIHVLDPSRARALMDGVHERLKRIALPLRLQTNRSIRLIPHPTSNAQPPGSSSRKITKPDALHVSHNSCRQSLLRGCLHENLFEADSRTQ